MKLIQVFQGLEEELARLGEEPESLAFTYRGLKGFDFTQLILQLQQEATDEELALVEDIFQQLAAHKPAQYIIGQADFHGLNLKVDERVLIPRPETEELVDLILAENVEKDLQVLDIGTGSGAIAISLAQDRPSWQVAASDISHQALEVAALNAQKYQSQIFFIQSDVFSDISEKYDIIVSNPPYISEKDKEEVGLNVLTSEPHEALFAAEEGLAIYRKIAQSAATYLTPNGKLYLEIGYKQGQVVTDLFQAAFPDKRVRLLQDQFGQDRMVVVDNG